MMTMFGFFTSTSFASSLGALQLQKSETPVNPSNRLRLKLMVYYLCILKILKTSTFPIHHSIFNIFIILNNEVCLKGSLIASLFSQINLNRFLNISLNHKTCKCLHYTFILILYFHSILIVRKYLRLKVNRINRESVFQFSR